MNEAEQLMAHAIVNEYLLETALFNLLCVTGDPPRALAAMRNQVIDSLKYRTRADAAPIGDPLVTQGFAIRYAGEVFDRLAANLAKRPSKA